MKEQSSKTDNEASQNISETQFNWSEDIYGSYISGVAKYYKLDKDTTDSTSKESKNQDTDNEAVTENEAGATSIEEKIGDENDQENEDGSVIKKGDVVVAEEITITGDDIVIKEEVIITGNDAVIQEGEEVNEDTGNATEIATKSTPSLKKIKGKLICVVGPDHSHGLAQEPWPKDVKLYQPYEVEQILLPDNANCLAVQAFLRMCNLDFEVVSRANAEFMSPSGKVPFIKCGAFIVSELEGIVQFVNNKGISLTTNLESEQKSDMRAYMSLVHNVLENAELYLCWCDKETYNEVTKPRNGSVYPWPLNHFQTWSKKSAVCKRLKMLGWYNKTLEDVYQEVENCCQALTDRLEGKEYFFGKRYTEMDALVYGHIYAILSTPLPTDDNRLAYLVQRYDKLTEHCRKVHRHVMNQDNIVVVATYSRMTVSLSETENEDDTQNDSEDKKEPELTAAEDYFLEDTEIESVVSSDVNTDDLLLTELPTELDALVFGHLFTILTTPLPNSQIANIVRNYPSLIHLVQRIEKNYFKRETKH